MINDVTDSMWMDQSKTRRKSKDAAQEKRIDDDTDGAMTIQFLEKVLSSAYLITGDHAGSLGLHPAVYFYGSNGRFYPAALLAAIKYFSRIKRNGKLLHFTQHRRGFEEFLIHHRLFIKQLCHIKGSRMRAVDSLVAMYEVVLGEVGANSDDQSIISKLKEDSRLSRLDETEGQSSPQRRRFSGDAKSAAFLREAVDSPIRCAHCDARLHSRSMSADHEQRLQDGGSGGSENLQWMHFFCNTGAKESEHSMSKRAGE